MFNVPQESAPVFFNSPISVIELAEHCHAALDPVLRGSARGQHRGEDKVGGVACGREGSLSLTGLVERANVQLLRLISALLLIWVGETGAKERSKRCQRKKTMTLQNKV